MKRCGSRGAIEQRSGRNEHGKGVKRYSDDRAAEPKESWCEISNEHFLFSLSGSGLLRVFLSVTAAHFHKNICQNNEISIFLMELL